MAKTGRQSIDLLTEDNRLEELSLNVFMGYVTDIKNKKTGEMGRAWAMDANNQCFDPKHNEYVQVCSERDVTPLRLFGGEPAKTSRAIIDRVAAQVTDDEINYAISGGDKSPRNLKWVFYICIMEAVILLIIIIAKIHQAGVF